MIPPLAAAFVGMTLTLLGCPKGTADAGADPDLDRFVQACLASSNLSRPVCECTAKKAKEQLSANGFAFLTATLGKEEAKAAELRGKLKVQEAMAAGTFMTRGPAQCAKELGGSPTDSAQSP